MGGSQSLCLHQPQCHRSASLLSRRSEASQSDGVRAAAHPEAKIISVRSDQGHAAASLPGGEPLDLQVEGLGPRLSCNRRFGVGRRRNRGRVLHPRFLTSRDRGVVAGEALLPGAQPARPRLGDAASLVHQPGIPSTQLIRPGVVPQQSVSLGQNLPVALQSRNVSGLHEREDDVEKASPRAGTSGDDFNIAGGEDDCSNPADGLGDPLGLAALDRHLLAAAFPRVTCRHLHLLAASARRDVGLDPEVPAPEGDELLIPRPAERAEDLQVIDGLQQVGLALTVIADQGRAALRKIDDLVLKIPEITETQPLENHLENLFKNVPFLKVRRTTTKGQFCLFFYRRASPE